MCSIVFMGQHGINNTIKFVHLRYDVSCVIRDSARVYTICAVRVDAWMYTFVRPSDHQVKISKNINK